MRKCCVKNCNFDKTYKNIKFFNVAKKFNAEWVDVVNRGSDWRPKKTTVICSLHFKKSDVFKNALRENVAPLHFTDKNLINGKYLMPFC